MYVCICNNLTSKKLLAMDSGVSDTKKIYSIIIVVLNVGNVLVTWRTLINTT